MLRRRAQKEGYEISGHLGGLQEGEKVTMMLYNGMAVGDFMQYQVGRDSGYVKNGEFHITGVVPEGPLQYWMVFDAHNGSGPDKPMKVIRMFINNNEHIVMSSPAVVLCLHHLKYPDMRLFG